MNYITNEKTRKTKQIRKFLSSWAKWLLSFIYVVCLVWAWVLAYYFTYNNIPMKSLAKEKLQKAYKVSIKKGDKRINAEYYKLDTLIITHNTSKKM